MTSIFKENQADITRGANLEGASEAQNNFVYEVLPESDKELVSETAECLADTFTGIQVGDAFIVEPLTKALRLSKETLFEFIFEHLKMTAKQGLTIIARDKKTGKVVGATAAESYDPDDMTPPFEGKFEPINNIMNILDFLDRKYVHFLQSTTGKKVQKDEHIHLFMCGVRLEKNKKYVAIEMKKLLERIGKEKGYKSIFTDATNFRSQKLSDLLNYTVPLDEEGNPIVYTYAKDPLFKNIPGHTSHSCKLYYKMLD
ncbi:hypothetical protein KZ483_20820 [Paenibacillus sp. sptzw28]|uniref:hypothetical protein n=1 Tax=Paenibacillus sp. sptzw28 TaxID=715179 RepID=UPI001C6E0689|nr:hypothetical protein [Paenibacillus sp. sptzw28]QYR20254.1 hypothetical protein KZ483_20820 [Paenibacillus sp. sptzw28]